MIGWDSSDTATLGLSPVAVMLSFVRACGVSCECSEVVESAIIGGERIILRKSVLASTGQGCPHFAALADAPINDMSARRTDVSGSTLAPVLGSVSSADRESGKAGKREADARARAAFASWFLKRKREVGGEVGGGERRGAWTEPGFGSLSIKLSDKVWGQGLYSTCERVCHLILLLFFRMQQLKTSAWGKRRLFHISDMTTIPV